MKFRCDGKLPVVSVCLGTVVSLQHWCTLTPSVQVAATDTRKHETWPIINMNTYVCKLLKTDAIWPLSLQLWHHLSVGRSWWSLTVVNPEWTQSRKAFHRFLWQNQEPGWATKRSCRCSSAMFHVHNTCERMRSQLGSAITGMYR